PIAFFMEFIDMVIREPLLFISSHCTAKDGRNCDHEKKNCYHNDHKFLPELRRESVVFHFKLTPFPFVFSYSYDNEQVEVSRDMVECLFNYHCLAVRLVTDSYSGKTILFHFRANSFVENIYYILYSP